MVPAPIRCTAFSKARRRAYWEPRQSNGILRNSLPTGRAGLPHVSRLRWRRARLKWKSISCCSAGVALFVPAWRYVLRYDGLRDQRSSTLAGILVAGVSRRWFNALAARYAEPGF